MSFKIRQFYHSHPVFIFLFFFRVVKTYTAPHLFDREECSAQSIILCVLSKVLILLAVWVIMIWLVPFHATYHSFLNFYETIISVFELRIALFYETDCDVKVCTL